MVWQDQVQVVEGAVADFHKDGLEAVLGVAVLDVAVPDAAVLLAEDRQEEVH